MDSAYINVYQQIMSSNKIYIRNDPYTSKLTGFNSFLVLLTINTKTLLFQERIFKSRYYT